MLRRPRLEVPVEQGERPVVGMAELFGERTQKPTELAFAAGHIREAPDA
jgi:hypothetical protein